MTNIIKEKLYVDKAKRDKPYKNWWSADEADAHDHMIRLVNTIDENQKERKWQDLRHCFLYQNRQGADVLQGYLDTARALPERYHVTYNVVKASIDTLTSRIAQNKPRIRILTVKGDYDKQQRAKKLTQYLDGSMAAANTYRQGADAFKDGGVFGTGVIKVIPDADKGRVVTERVLVTELYVDELEGAYGNPQSIYQVRLVSKDRLMAMFPEHVDKIIDAMPAPRHSQREHTVDMIKVYEGWHLPDATTKGRHIIAIEGVNLHDEEWIHDRFPFAFFRYSNNIASFYGQGIAEELLGTQLEINKLLRDIQRAQHLIAVPRILQEYSSKVIASHLNNETGSIVKYQGTKPDFINPIAMNNEIYNHVKWLIQSAYEKVGLSQLSVASKKPAGLDSGRAIREFRDTESERFRSTEAHYDEFFSDIAELMVLFSKDLYSDNKDLQIVAEDRKFIESIKWSEVDLENDQFVTRVQSSSILPTSPSAKIQKVEEYVRAGWMDKEAAIKLLNFPDVEAWETLETADRDYAEKIIGDILGKGKYSPPEPEMLLDKDINIARKAYLEARAEGAAEERLEMLLRWIEAAASIMPTPVVSETAAPQGEPLPLPQTGLAPQI